MTASLSVTHGGLKAVEIVQKGRCRAGVKRSADWPVSMFAE